jgi:hypothetical protein
MSSIHFVGGEKGGVGKSVFARLLSQYFLDRGRAHVGLDADQSHPTLTRYYADYTRPLNLDHFESIDQVMEAAIDTDIDVLVDLPAQSQRFLDRWIDDNAVLEMTDEVGIPVYYWYVVDDGRDSVGLYRDFLGRYGNAVRPVLVMNQGCGSDFSAVDAVRRQAARPAQEQQAEAGDAAEAVAADAVTTGILLPGLHAGTMRKIDKLSFSFWAAVNATDNAAGCLSLMERQRAKVWQRKAFAVIAQVLD